MYHKVFVALGTICRFLKGDPDSYQILAFCMETLRTSFLCKKYSAESSLIYTWGCHGLGRRYKSWQWYPWGRTNSALETRLYTHELLHTWLGVQDTEEETRQTRV